MITTILFDLDGTLLPMDQEVFVKAYFGGMAAWMAPHGYEAKPLIDAIWQGTAAMVRNTGERTNEEAFWDCFAGIFGEKSRRDIPLFDAFYVQEFYKVQAVCGRHPHVPALIRALQGAGLRLVLATNPIFPPVATHARIGWAGLAPADFVYCTTYDNSRHCKPHPDYYRDILAHLSLTPEECLMVGNDVAEDMVAATLGMKVFLLTDCLINKAGTDITRYPRGDIEALTAYLKAQIPTLGEDSI